MTKNIVIAREHKLLTHPENSLLHCMHTSKMTYANWAYSYLHLCDLLDVDPGVSVREELVRDITPYDDTHRIIINGSRESNLNIEDRLHQIGGGNLISKTVNSSGKRVVQKELREGTNPQELEHLLGQGYTIFANNKILTYLALEDNWPETIPLIGYGHRHPSFKGEGIQSTADKVVIKPVDRSHGNGIVFVPGSEIDVVSNPYAIFGSHLVQSYVGAPPELKDLHRRVKGITDPNLKLSTDMRVMLTELDKGYGVIGHIRVAINKNGKANLSQSTENPEERAYAIGLNPNQPITDKFDREICKIYGINPDRPRVPKDVARRSAELMKKFGRPLLGLDYGLARENGNNVLKLYEANVTPGSAIYSYYGATKSLELDDFIKRYDFHLAVDQLSVDQLNMSAEEIAKHRLVNILCKNRAFQRVRVDKAMAALGLDNSIYGGDYKW